MFSAKSSTKDGKVRPWQSRLKIQFVKPSGGSGFLFSEMGVETKPLAQDWDSRWKSEVPAIG